MYEIIEIMEEKHGLSRDLSFFCGSLNGCLWQRSLHCTHALWYSLLGGAEPENILYKPQKLPEFCKRYALLCNAWTFQLWTLGLKILCAASMLCAAFPDDVHSHVPAAAFSLLPSFLAPSGIFFLAACWPILFSYSLNVESLRTAGVWILDGDNQFISQDKF